MIERRSHDEPELVPPAELLRLRTVMSDAPEPAVRARHLAATVTASREHALAGPAGRFARHGVRVAAAVVASLVITTGLAGAQLLPEPAQRLLGSVSDRFAPPAPPPPPAAPPATSVVRDADTPEVGDDPVAPPAADEAPVVSEALATGIGEAPAPVAPVAPPPTQPASPPTTVIPGPSLPGSPDDPTDPGPVDPGPTDPGTDGGPTEPTTTTTTTIDRGVTTGGAGGTTATEPAAGGSD